MDVVPADGDDDPPVLLVLFDVSRSYRGAQNKQVQVETGLGGGDCGYDFEVGKHYLVYAYREDSGQLSTGICTATALLEDSQWNLAYLRGDPMNAETTKMQPPIALGKLCGRVIRNDQISSADSRVFLLRLGSPLPSDEAEPDGDGSFALKASSPANIGCYSGMACKKVRSLRLHFSPGLGSSLTPL